MKSEVYYNYMIITDEVDGKITAKVINNRAKKEWTKQKHYYSFKTVERRAEWIASFKKQVQEREGWKLDRAIAKKSFVNPAKVGDILYSSWGYDQTNIDFYQVTAVKGKQVVIRQICQKVDESKDRGDMSEYVLPIKDSFRQDGKEYRKLAQMPYNNAEGYWLSLTSYSSAEPWDGESKYQSHYA